jgi:hypothetical protein
MSLVDDYNETRSDYGFENILLTALRLEPSQFTQATKTDLTFSFPLKSGSVIKLTQTSKLASDDFKTVINVTSTPPTDSPTEHSFFKDSHNLTMILFEAIGVDEVTQFLKGAHLHFILNLLESNYTFIPKLRYCGIVEISGKTNVFVLIDPVTMTLQNKLLETSPTTDPVNYAKQIRRIIVQLTHEINNGTFTQPALIRFNTFDPYNLFVTADNQIRLVNFSRSILKISSLDTSQQVLIKPIRNRKLHEPILNKLEDMIHFGVAMIELVDTSKREAVYNMLNQVRLKPLESTMKTVVEVLFKLFNNVSTLMQRISLFDVVSLDVLNEFGKTEKTDTDFNVMIDQLKTVTEIENKLTSFKESTPAQLPVPPVLLDESVGTVGKGSYYYKFLKYYTKYNNLNKLI